MLKLLHMNQFIVWLSPARCAPAALFLSTCMMMLSFVLSSHKWFIYSNFNFSWDINRIWWHLIALVVAPLVLCCKWEGAQWRDAFTDMNPDVSDFQFQDTSRSLFGIIIVLWEVGCKYFWYFPLLPSADVIWNINKGYVLIWKKFEKNLEKEHCCCLILFL